MPPQLRHRTLRPYSLTVHSISPMDIAHDIGETEASLNLKCDRVHAQKLWKLLGDYLETVDEVEGGDMFTANIKGLLK